MIEGLISYGYMRCRHELNDAPPEDRSEFEIEGLPISYPEQLDAVRTRYKEDPEEDRSAILRCIMEVQRLRDATTQCEWSKHNIKPKRAKRRTQRRTQRRTKPNLDPQCLGLPQPDPFCRDRTVLIRKAFLYRIVQAMNRIGYIMVPGLAIFGKRQIRCLQNSTWPNYVVLWCRIVPA